ncbi:ABC transporter substrate-binding protein [Cupriavidus basilensis]
MPRGHGAALALPLEQGFDVKLTAATHGGCMRLLTLSNSGVTDLKSLKGKTVAVSDMASPAKNFFSILLAKRGIRPRARCAVAPVPGRPARHRPGKGEAQAAPTGTRARTCCARSAAWSRSPPTCRTNTPSAPAACLGTSRQPDPRGQADRPALTHAVLQAQDWTVANPEGAARHFAEFAKVPQADVVAMLKSHTHGHHPVGADLLKNWRNTPTNSSWCR